MSWRSKKKAVSSAKFSEGVTATGDALELARHKVLNSARQGVGQLLVLVSDGRTNHGVNPVVAANKIKADGVHIVTVGITDDIDE